MPSFQYLLIPADSNKPLEVKTGDTSGGLTNDILVKSAKEYFYEQSGNAAQLQILQQASQSEKEMIAQQFRNTPQGSHLQHLTNDQIVESLESNYAASSASCEIMALTIPTSSNQYQAVSMYLGENSASEKSAAQKNERACSLLQACGHRLPETSNQKQPGIYGDVFVGRCIDDEGGDVWKRVDFLPQDLNPDSDWIRIAKQSGGGGGSGSSNVSSLSGTLNQFQGGQPAAIEAKMLEEEGYIWDQSEDEVELKFTIDAHITAKQVKIKFAHSSLQVTVAGETLLEGTTGGAVVVDESTYTLQPDGKGQKELCVVLTKRDEGQTWARAVKK